MSPKRTAAIGRSLIHELILSSNLHRNAGFMVPVGSSTESKVLCRFGPLLARSVIANQYSGRSTRSNKKACSSQVYFSS